MASTAFIEEMCAFLGEDALNFSADEKAAFVVGPAGLVSRYHQNNNVTEAGVIINRFDHDYKFAKYLIGMTGYLELNNPDVYETYFDALGRERIKGAVSGEVHTKLHSKLHAKADLLWNMDELRSRLEAAQEADELPSVVSVCVDGGAAYGTTRDGLVLLAGRIFRDFGLECLVIYRRCGGLSAHNEVEHVWSVTSKRCAGTIVSACAPGDQEPPHLMGVNNTERLAKERDVFENAMDVIIEKIAGTKFDDYTINVEKSTVDESIKYMKGRNEDYKLLMSHNSNRKRSTNENAARVFEEYKEILRHTQFNVYSTWFTSCQMGTVQPHEQEISNVDAVYRFDAKIWWYRPYSNAVASKRRPLLYIS
jgi:hypothetical protein